MRKGFFSRNKIEWFLSVDKLVHRFYSIKEETYFFYWINSFAECLFGFRAKCWKSFDEKTHQCIEFEIRRIQPTIVWTFQKSVLQATKIKLLLSQLKWNCIWVVKHWTTKQRLIWLAWCMLCRTANVANEHDDCFTFYLSSEKERQMEERRTAYILQHMLH